LLVESRPAEPRNSAEPKPPEAAPPKPPAPKPTTTGGRKTGPVRRVFDLTPDKFPTLNEIGRNLTLAALKGEIDPLIGRENLVDAVIDILLMKQVNNPCLIGEAGVGKTAIVEGLALRLAGNVETYGKLGSAVIVEIQTSALLAGTSLRGAFSERMRKLRDEVAAGAGQVIVFMDEIHTIMGAGTGDGPLDAANDLKSALSRGRFPLIGATTKAEYERHIEKDPAMERRFQVVEVTEPTVPEAIAILSGVAPLYAKHHQVCYSHDAITSAVHLSKRFINDRCLPDKAIAVLDRAGAQTRRAGRQVVQADDIARAVHVLTAVPMERLAADERGRIRDLAVDLQARIVGHDAAMQRIARRIQRNYAGFSGDRPLASFLFVGAPGVGKTETGRALAQALFVVDDALVRFDMNEYTESHSIARLIGSPPGYVGHAQAGLLAQALQKRPYRVLLFDEVDRAAPEVLALLLQLLDAGRVTDNHGQVVDVRNCILAMTSNQGADLLASPNSRRSIGFGRVDAPIPEGPTVEPVDQAVLDRARKALPADLWTRIDDTIVFHPLTLHAGRQVVQRQLELSARRLDEARMIRFHADETVVDLVMGPGMDPSLGVRPLRARIEDVVEAFVTERILDGALQPGADVILTVTDGRLELHPRAAVEPAELASLPS
jgi:ATP-dependent Clp protease ATP-binding subunit ClpC